MDYSTSVQDIISEFIADVEKRHSQMSEYKSNVGIGIAYSEASSRYQNYVKDVISRQISTLTGISPDMAAKQFDTFLQDAVITEYLSLSKSDTSTQFFALKKQIKNEPDKKKKGEFSEQLNALKENVYSQIPPNEKTQLADKFIENQIVPKHANLKMKAEINAPEDGYCLKAITESLYQVVGKYGRPDFLPKNTPENGIPKTFLANLEQDKEISQCIFKNSPNQTFNDLVENKKIAPGAIVIISNGKGEPHHAMFWTGKRDEKGEPLLIGFNGMGKDEEKDVNASFTKDGNIRQMTVIDTSALLQSKLPDLLMRKNDIQGNNKDLIRSSFSNPHNQKAAEKIFENKTQMVTTQDIRLLKMKVLSGKSR